MLVFEIFFYFGFDYFKDKRRVNHEVEATSLNSIQRSKSFNLTWIINDSTADSSQSITSNENQTATKTNPLLTTFTTRSKSTKTNNN